MSTATVEPKRAYTDRARFYQVDGARWPSVTTVLDVIGKPALLHWYANQERKAFETAMLTVAATHPVISAERLLDAVITAVSGVKAADREKTKAATIGTAAHALIEWHLKRQLGKDVGPEPTVPDAALLAVESWKDWAKAVGFRPLAIEQPVLCAACGYAGTMDWLAEVNGVRTLGDIKTGKAIYPEAFLQNVAYRHAAAQRKLPSAAGLILRLPKTLEDPAFEAMPVPELPLEDFLAALRLWRWQRSMEGLPTGSRPTGVHR